MFEATLSAIDLFLSPGPLLAFFLVIPYSLLGGLLPASNLPLTVILLGLVGRIDPIVAIVLVVAKGAQGDITEPVPSILMGIPGSRAAQATILDGYPLAQQGKAGYALGASYTTTLVGGVIGAVALFAAIPLARELLKLFGSAEFFLLALIGVGTVAVVSSGAVVKGLLTAALGLGIAFIGFSQVGGEVRATFGISYLFDGLSIIPVIVGLFAIPEVVGLIVSNRAIAKDYADEVLKGKESQRQAWEGMKEGFRHKWLMVRASLIGVLVGMMPGLGAGAGHWIAYAQARQTEKGGTETFGKGDIRGVLASDAPNNSADGGELIPTLFFSIPGSSGSAIFLALLLLLGFVPGRDMVEKHLDITILMVLVIALSNIVVIPIMFVFAGTIAKFTALRPHVIVPFVVVITLLAAYQTTQSLTDLVVVLALSVLGIFMKAYGWPRPPILIAVVLSQLLEKYLWLAVNSYGLAMLARPPFLIILFAALLVVFWTVRAQRGAQRAAREAQRTVSESA